MKKIKYSKKVIIKEQKINTETQEVIEPEEFIIENKSFICTNETYDMWLQVCKDNYSQFGTITSEDYTPPKSEKEIQATIINNLLIENNKKDIALQSIAEQINSLNIKLQGGVDNV